MQKTNEEECTKYADVACKYTMKKDETLTKYYKTEPKILYYGPSILITTYKKNLHQYRKFFFDKIMFAC